MSRFLIYIFYFRKIALVSGQNTWNRTGKELDQAYFTVNVAGIDPCLGRELLKIIKFIVLCQVKLCKEQLFPAWLGKVLGQGPRWIRVQHPSPQGLEIGKTSSSLFSILVYPGNFVSQLFTVKGTLSENCFKVQNFTDPNYIFGIL